MRRVLLALALAGCAAKAPPAAPASAPAEQPAARKAPDFTLPSTEGEEVTLSKLLARGPVILAFFPKAFTGG